MGLSVLCDGTADCSNGNDETTPICESKFSDGLFVRSLFYIHGCLLSIFITCILAVVSNGSLIIE